MSVSLDGFMESAEHKLDWVRVDEELHRFINHLQGDIGAHVYGRRMYETMIYWETAEQDPTLRDYELEFARIWKAMPKYVFSRTLKQVQGKTQLLDGSPAEQVASLKREMDKDIEVAGATLASDLVRRDLIDEYHLFVNPIILGRGTPLFPELNKPLSLTLVETRPFGSGVVYLRYRRA